MSCICPKPSQYSSKKKIQLHLSVNGLTPITLSAICGADSNTRLVRNSVQMTGVCSCLLP